MPASDTPLVFLDTETSGLDAHRHHVWELAAVRRNPDGTVSELHRFLRFDRASADETALRYGRFHDRYRQELAVPAADALADLCAFADRGVLLGLNISFDVRFIERTMHDCNVRGAARLAATWHYSPVDVKSLAAGVLCMPPPWRSDTIAELLGVRPSAFDRHGALADCYFTAAIYDAAMALSARRAAACG